MCVQGGGDALADLTGVAGADRDLQSSCRSAAISSGVDQAGSLSSGLDNSSQHVMVSLRACNNLCGVIHKLVGYDEEIRVICAIWNLPASFSSCMRHLKAFFYFVGCAL